MEKTRILCFGDSNTRGYIPGSDHQRFSETIRFPKVLQHLLGNDFEVIEEGLNSRTLVSEDTRPGKEGKNGSKYLIPCLDSHDPLDRVILFLGTNELKNAFNYDMYEVGRLLEEHFIHIIQQRKSQVHHSYPKIILIGIPLINENTEYAKEKYRGGSVKSQELQNIYVNIAKKNHCFFANTNDLLTGNDGIHFTQESHIQLAKRLYTLFV